MKLEKKLVFIFNITSFPEKHNKKFHFILTSMNHL